MASSPQPGLAIALLRASDWFDAALRARLEALGWPGLNRSQSLVFANLDRDGVRPAELARRVGVSRQSMQALLEGLVDHDLVAVEDDPHDGRATRCVLTARGRRLVAAAGEELRGVEAELASRIGRAAVADLRCALDHDWGDPPGP